MQDIAASSKLEKNIDHPLATFLNTVSCLHCMTVSFTLEVKDLGRCGAKKRQSRC